MSGNDVTKKNIRGEKLRMSSSYPPVKTGQGDFINAGHPASVTEKDLTFRKGSINLDFM